MQATSAVHSTAERIDRLRLIRSENVGPITFHALVARYGTAAAAIAALPELARQGGRKKPLTIAGKGEAERELAAMAALGTALFHGEADYPPLLAALDDAPPVLSVRGHVPLLAHRAVAMVGARNASLNGRKLAEIIARDLAAAGVVVVSGLARGIDGAAHHGALLAGAAAGGGTVAVMAGGVDHIYPAEHEALYAQILATGAVLSELPPATQPTARHFPRRNRLISGLALGVVVVEAALRSGSLITARFAAEQGREVMAVPGSPLDPRCRGGNDLLRHGAALVESAADVLSALRADARPGGAFAERRKPEGTSSGPLALRSEDLAEARRLVHEALGPSPVQVDELVRACHLSHALVATVLLELELAGRLQRHPGGRVALAFGEGGAQGDLFGEDEPMA